MSQDKEASQVIEKNCNIMLKTVIFSFFCKHSYLVWLVYGLAFQCLLLFAQSSSSASSKSVFIPQKAFSICFHRGEGFFFPFLFLFLFLEKHLFSQHMFSAKTSLDFYIRRLRWCISWCKLQRLLTDSQGTVPVLLNNRILPHLCWSDKIYVM